MILEGPSRELKLIPQIPKQELVEINQLYEKLIKTQSKLWWIGLPFIIVSIIYTWASRSKGFKIENYMSVQNVVLVIGFAIIFAIISFITISISTFKTFNNYSKIENNLKSLATSYQMDFTELKKEMNAYLIANYGGPGILKRRKFKGIHRR